MNQLKRAAAILTGPETHLDHLGIISELLKIPLIVTEQETFDIAKIFYPHFDIHLMDMADISLHFLADNFDVIFHSGKFWNLEISAAIELLHKKKVHFIYCPHGNSDKGSTLKDHVDQDICLYYGKHMLDLLTRSGAVNKVKHLIATGNYRHRYYEKNKHFYDPLIKKKISSFLQKNKKTILYAPTWNDGENLSSFFSSCDSLINQLHTDYNFIIKLHPFLETFHPAHTFAITEKYKNIEGLLFITKIPTIYPILSISDVYIGDFSSIGYDFLLFNRPMFFLTDSDENLSKKNPTFLHQCGKVIPKESLCHIKEVMEKTLEADCKKTVQVQKEIYDYAFGQIQDINEIKTKINSALNN
jgi:hypothetical protein